ncbi:hypothetical protein [Pseudomonas oryzihabitans]|uniref:hypothetical protein n=1 Tax=Pseudomonas oryzihabitans TaxID=47885 RepID=UPI0028565666|nr:hypothetical protein [Pseudomonas psychrotolerans]MDR6675849.1 hypothetical protein [Pseudomonas psychrotolerans]
MSRPVPRQPLEFFASFRNRRSTWIAEPAVAALAFQAASKIGIGSGTTSIPFSEAASPKGAFGQALGGSELGAAPLASIRTQRIDLERAKALNAEPFSGNRRYLGAGAPVVTQTPSGQRCAPAFLPKAPRRENAHECSELVLQFRHGWGGLQAAGAAPVKAVTIIANLIASLLIDHFGCSRWNST